jgi:hypothetical protein
VIGVRRLPIVLKGPLIATVAAVLAAACAATARADVRITTDPGLRPRFDTQVPDYVSRCVPGKPLRFTVSATHGDSVAVGNGPKQPGDRTVDADVQSDESVAVRVTASGHNTTHHVRCLPQDFPDWKVHRHRKPESQWYVLTPVGRHPFGYVAVFDARGVPVWWMHSSWYAPFDGKLLPNGSLAWSRIPVLSPFGVSDQGGLEEHTLDGRTLRVLATEGSPTDFHDVERTPDGNYLLDTYRRRPKPVDLTAYGGRSDTTVYDGEIQEMTPDGRVVWKWNSKNRIHLSENTWWTHRKDDPVLDVVHINSMEPDGNGIVVSARFIDAVFRIDRKTKTITWKLGGTKEPESLTVKHDPLAANPLGGQHDARLYSDHTLTVFDNGSSNYQRRKHTPRAVRYRIDTKTHTATLLEAHSESAVSHSSWGGSARKLPGGNWVVFWGGTGLMTERTASGDRVLELEFLGDKYSYRAFPIPSGRLTAQQLRRGMDAIVKAGRDEVPQPAR